MRHPRQIFVLAGEHGTGVRTRQPESPGDDRRERGARIVVAADHRADRGSLEQSEDALDLVEGIGGAGARLLGPGDQLLDWRARAVVEAKVDPRWVKPLELAMVTVGGADHQHGALGGRGWTACAWRPAVDLSHARFLCPKTDGARVYDNEGGKARLIGSFDFATVPASARTGPRSMPLHFGKVFAAIALLTVAAFVLWLLFTTFFATEQAEQKIEQSGALELGARVVAPA